MSKEEPEVKEGDAEEKDNGMPGNPSALYGIVGILEGFEPPGYQTDNEAVITGGTVIEAGAETATQLAGQNNSILITAPNVQDDTSSLPEQIAWMHSTEEAGMVPAKTEEQVLQIVGDYLDSLENTNKAAAGNDAVATGRGTEAAAASQKNGVAAAETAQEGSGISRETAAAQTQGEKKQEVQNAGSVKVSAKEADIMESQMPDPAAQTDAGIKTAQAGTEPQMSTQAPEAAKPESARESILRIVDKVSTKASEGQYDFDVDLKPDFMGSVNIKLTMKDGALKVQITADETAGRVLSDQTSSLQSLLKDKGIPVSNIDVMYDSSAAPSSEGQTKHEGSRQQQGNLFYESAADGNTVESARERYDFYLGNSSIEYLA